MDHACFAEAIWQSQVLTHAPCIYHVRTCTICKEQCLTKTSSTRLKCTFPPCSSLQHLGKRWSFIAATGAQTVKTITSYLWRQEYKKGGQTFVPPKKSKKELSFDNKPSFFYMSVIPPENACLGFVVAARHHRSLSSRCRHGGSIVALALQSPVNRLLPLRTTMISWTKPFQISPCSNKPHQVPNSCVYMPQCNILALP